jgi:4-carboxymuconolactone decarboxylase
MNDGKKLGGRLELLDPDALTKPQKELYDSMNARHVPWAEDAGFIARLGDGRLIGPFNSLLESPEIAASFLALQAAEGENTSLGERVRQIVILTVGAVWGAQYELYAHTAVARKAGLSDEVIHEVIQGRATGMLTAEEQVAQRFTWQLAASHQVDNAVYAEAIGAFGARGIVDLIVLAGCYHTVSSLLNAFKVPVPQ